MNNLFAELKRRNIIRVAGVYAVVAWLIMQVISVMTPALVLPDWVDSFFALLLIIGLPVALILAWAFELTPEGMKPTQAVADGASITTQTGRKLDLAIIFGLVLVAGLMLMHRFVPGSATQPVSAGNAIEASIAVLPFVDLSREGDQEYFGDGIAEELLNVFAKVKDMKVAGRTSSFAYKDENQDLREIGRVLGVATILEGSIRKQGQRVRVTAQLVKADDGFHIWSETYDRELTDIFAVQDEISREISQALMPHLMGDDAPQLSRAARTDVDAYEDFLEARQLIHGRTVVGFKRAKALLEGVIKTDPEYAPAYAALAHAELSLSDASGSYGDTPFSQVRPVIEENLEKAFALDPDLATAHAVRGIHMSVLARTSEAISSLEQALEINPNYLDAKMWLAFEYIALRRHRDTGDMLVEVFDADPLLGAIGANTVTQLGEIGDIERAQQVVDRLNTIDPDNPNTKWTNAVLDMQKRQWGEGIKKGLDVLKTDPGNMRYGDGVAEYYVNIGAGAEVREYGSAIYAVYGYWIDGNLVAARNELEAMMERSPDLPLLTNEYVNLLVAMRDFEGAIEFFERTWEDLRDFEKKTFDAYGGVRTSFASLALALQQTDRTELAKQTLARLRTSIDIDQAGGDATLRAEEAQWQVLSGNPKAAIAELEAELEVNTVMPVLILERPVFDPLRADPAFIALKSRNLARVNEERAIVGLSQL